mmetsp:Transcript_134959/g.336756  ORF Transcript_134959/g.336756 Transcript_134959/m.336756 type:complete len:216 (+) Transcript_134959:270-917(+)
MLHHGHHVNRLRFASEVEAPVHDLIHRQVPMSLLVQCFEQTARALPVDAHTREKGQDLLFIDDLIKLHLRNAPGAVLVCFLECFSQENFQPFLPLHLLDHSNRVVSLCCFQRAVNEDAGHDVQETEKDEAYVGDPQRRVERAHLLQWLHQGGPISTGDGFEECKDDAPETAVKLSQILHLLGLLTRRTPSNFDDACQVGGDAVHHHDAKDVHQYE